MIMIRNFQSEYAIYGISVYIIIYRYNIYKYIYIC